MSKERIQAERRFMLQQERDEERRYWDMQRIEKVTGDQGTSTLLPVPFRDAILYVAGKNGEPYVPMRPIVEGIGLRWQRQHVKIRQRFGSVVTMMVTTGFDGKRYEMLCLPLKKLPAWLYTIHPNKVRDPQIRAKVLAYQAECDELLWQHWGPVFEAAVGLKRIIEKPRLVPDIDSISLVDVKAQGDARRAIDDGFSVKKQ